MALLNSPGRHDPTRDLPSLGIRSVLGKMLGLVLTDRVYWAVKLASGQMYSELTLMNDPSFPAGKRPFDWALDLVANGEVKRIKELFLFCPPNRYNPAGQTARLPLLEPGTAFQFKVGFLDSNLAGGTRSFVAQVIGRVDDKETGDCTCFVWDGLACHGEGALLTPFSSNVYRFGTWRPEIAPIGQISFEVQGLSLG